MEAHIQYLKSHFQDFSVVAFFEHFSYATKELGDSAFKAAVESILTWSNDAPVCKWAGKIKEGSYCLLNTLEVEAYWGKVTMVRSGLKRTQLHELLEEGVVDAALEEQKNKRRNKQVTNNPPVLIEAGYCSPGHGHFQYATPLVSDEPSVSASSPVDQEPHKKKNSKPKSRLTGNGMYEYALPEGSVKWEVRSQCISSCFMKVHKLAVTQAEKGLELTYCLELALNFIFLVDENDAVEYGLAHEVWQSILQEMQEEYRLVPISDDVEANISTFAKAAKNNYDSCQSVIDSWTNGPSELKQMATNVLQKYTPFSSPIDDMNEDTFIMNVLRPVVDPFLKNTTLLKREGYDGRVAGSRDRLKSVKAAKDRFADGIMMYSYNDYRIPLLVTEVKPPKKCRNQARPDFTKIANEMKDTMDRMVKSDRLVSKQIFCMSLLVEGTKCTVYVMDLHYQAVYRLYPVNTFYLPESHNDLRRLVDAYEGMAQLTSLLQKTATTCHRAALGFDDDNDDDESHGSFIMPLFNTPKDRKR